jgi:hypothetical protein
LDFSLFQVKVFRPQQKDMFGTETAPPGFRRTAILEKPTEYSLGVRWYIGNVSEVNAESLYFPLCRTARSRVPLLDDTMGSFVETEFDSAPYTHVLMDVPREIAAIAHKSSLAPGVTAIALRLERLLTQTEVARRERLTSHVSAISRPDDSIRKLREAFVVSELDGRCIASCSRRSCAA